MQGNRPQFLNKNEIFLVLLKFLLRGYRDPLIRRSHSFTKMLTFYMLRKKLLLTKMIKFNNRYYSTLSLPGFPSPAYYNLIKNGGMNFTSAGTALKKQIDTVLLAITSNCSLSCNYCYEKQNINSSINVPVEKWIEVVSNLQSSGTSIIILTGGEPLLKMNNLLKILEKGNKDLSDFHVHTSGYSVTREKVKELKQAGLTAAGIGLDDYLSERHDKIRGSNSFNEAVKALNLFNEEGILTYVNFCPHKEILSLKELIKYFDFVKSLNVSIIELLEPRPCGDFLFKSRNELITEEERQVLLDFTLMGNTKKEFKDHPLIYYLAHIEGENQMGCMMGGLSHFYIDSLGNVNPCVFMKVSFGNILNEDFDIIFKRMRAAVPFPFHGECPSLLISDLIKSKKEELNTLPIPYFYISEEWRELFLN